ncbi:hypothetical protein PO909_011570 [Leuciscus waleckii]
MVGDCSLERHTEEFLDPVHLHYNKESLNAETRACGDGPQGNFQEFVHQVLFHCGFPFTIGEMEGDHNTTVHTAHFVPPTATIPMDRKPEPTADKEPELAAMPELMPEPNIVQEPEPKNVGNIVLHRGRTGGI